MAETKVKKRKARPQAKELPLKKLRIEMEYVMDVLLRLLRIPSPTGYTDQAVHFTGAELERLGIPFELTRRGAIRADLRGEADGADRAVVAHLDTLGAMVKYLKDNGRMEVVPIGTWSARFAEGARVTVFTDTRARRGTLLPLKASGHVYSERVDTQEIAWHNLELRVDEECESREDLEELGFNIGDFVAIDPQPEVTPTGFINSRHLDDKVGVAIILGAAKAVLDAKIKLPVTAHLLFTISEEVGSGASAILHGHIAEMLTIDNGTQAPGQGSREFGVTVAMQDESGPFDYHLTHKVLRLCREYGIGHQRDVFRYYRSDSASAVEAGNDIRTAMVCFGLDSSHGYERTHVDAIRSVAELVTLYLQSEPTFSRDREEMGPLRGFPYQPF